MSTWPPKQDDNGKDRIRQMLWIEGKSSNPEADNGYCSKCPGRVVCCKIFGNDGVLDPANPTNNFVGGYGGCVEL